jgi:ABC-type Fe3+/spermidine/putrescine transport system ATPase subunit
MVFQNYALFPHLNVFENVAFGLRARHKSKAEMNDRVTSALELVQLPGYGKRAVDELSGGQQQRVAIARAIAIEPALLLFDEPLSNLDVSLREETRSELRELVTRLGLTAVYVTHDQEEAFALCDRISVMVGGKLMQTGRPRELYEQPAEISVASFLGRNNLIKAMRLSSSKTADGEFKTLEGEHTLRMPVKHEELAPLNKPVYLRELTARKYSRDRFCRCDFNRPCGRKRITDRSARFANQRARSQPALHGDSLAGSSEAA